MLQKKKEKNEKSFIDRISDSSGVEHDGAKNSDSTRKRTSLCRYCYVSLNYKRHKTSSFRHG